MRVTLRHLGLISVWVDVKVTGVGALWLETFTDCVDFTESHLFFDSPKNS